MTTAAAAVPGAREHALPARIRDRIPPAVRQPTPEDDGTSYAQLVAELNVVAGAAVFIDVPIGVLRGALAAAVGGVGHLLHLPVDAILPLLSHPLPPELEFQPLFDFGGVVQRGLYVEAHAVYSGPPRPTA